ncbi:MAG: HesA/MoeB/ThiF family protein [Candidatus Binataceae bacterium]
MQSVLIVGAGGLGVPAAIALARAGAISFALLDADRVELSNLPRQVIFTEADIGMPKASAAARRLRQAYPGVAVRAVEDELNLGNARRIIAEFAFVIDATDNPLAKFLINDTCVALGRPFVYAGVLGLTGQVMTVIPGHSACLRCLFEEPPDADEVTSCQQAGILGPVAGAIGEIEAAEALHVLRGEPPELSGMMFTYNAAAAERIRLTPVSARTGCGCGARSEPARA